MGDRDAHGCAWTVPLSSRGGRASRCNVNLLHDPAVTDAFTGNAAANATMVECFRDERAAGRSGDGRKVVTRPHASCAESALSQRLPRRVPTILLLRWCGEAGLSLVARHATLAG